MKCAPRVALRIISGKNIYNFAILENLRIFQNCLFTGGVVTESSICSAAFCESAALRETNPLRLTARSLPERVPFPFLRKKLQDLAKQAGQNRKIRAIAHFNELKTYKSAKKISLFLVRLLSGLRLLYGRNLLL